MQEGEPKVEAFKIHCGQQSGWIAPPKTLTNSYTRFLLQTQPYFNSLTRTPKYKLYIITLPKYTVLIHWWVVYAGLLIC